MEQQSFLVSARKYRPQRWETVVGQDAVTSTLKKAVTTGEIGQSYLFCGPRGVGKTTCARIFARAINTGVIEEADAATSLDVMDGGDQADEWAFNIFELDGASNNKVEDIRGLIDQVRIPPQNGKYKVYIIDEVHMLSQGAFNAFLKTLEEPPPHAVFILATTEKHKVIPTILSRCQIFDFNRITVTGMVDHLQKIVSDKGVTAEPEALHVIAQKADGAMRDALSIFDQVVAFTSGNLTYDAVTKNLNVLGHDLYFRLTDQIIKEDIPAVLKEINEVVKKGYDLHHFISGLAGHFRNLVMAKQPGVIDLLEVSDTIKGQYSEVAQNAEMPFLQNALNELHEADMKYKQAHNPRLHTELCLMKLCSIHQRIREKKKAALA
ncbi:DNA polymerase III subunit gamma/tau [Sanyastnella coralliicola]|uniref:DNA polymerase III subunit gamma/tau n=1 Tax=Sanyastnella coralliicola TaxID=3069118 RepID=UPI0027B96B5C|nr:DNA polymerase III subunit gamma/tau [Longitalea sp. SCSIO 12813]